MAKLTFNVDIIHRFLQQNLNSSQDLAKILMVLQGCFVISDIVFGSNNPTYNPSPEWWLNFLTQFSGIKTLEELVLETQCKGPWPNIVYEEWQPHT